ncbi:SusD/RagB family nutrient-binding outer membrane lipoprotein [Solitalea sp. MAHUQ-68]|uniref:SusD/RagB family nutrient-binding outer membrane lipoprotein n=1 Tax=Solitalea agri TaxID=2953739 RepID=A0A9X2JC17_9SPHI|nr:SusD/RagB family nutrient-binding outer membrane lipoprotein [Solitalea agri]MCO4291295.1 SusD/RagB family nutrient-binding outer membrane lipoprotein [Solitalea agri]
MKTSLINKLIVSIGLIALVLSGGCTKKFDEINTNPTQATPESVDPTFFVPTIQRYTFSPDREVWWRAQLIHADRFADHFRFGAAGSWWDDGLSYEYSPDYTDWYWRDYYTRIPASIVELLKTTRPEGSKPNKNVYAVGLILKAMYYQMLTDSFGDIPYSQVADGKTLSPQYDAQLDIYKQSITDLGDAITLIGDATIENAFVKVSTDLFYNGDMQKWKKLANSMRLRMGMRALGAQGADFAATAVIASLGQPLMTAITETAKVDKDPAQTGYLDDGYNNIWWVFGGEGSKWKLSQSLIHILSSTNDPRLAKYAKPIAGGAITYPKTTDAEYLAFIENLLNTEKVPFTKSTTANDIVYTIAANTYYLGQPARMNDKIKSLLVYNLFSDPSDYVIGNDYTQRSTPMMPGWAYSASEAQFYKALAILKGVGSGNAEQAYQDGIRLAMEQFSVTAGDIATFMGTNAAKLNGSAEENYEKVATQLWVSLYGHGFEAWAVARKTGYPKSVTQDIPNNTKIYAITSLGVGYPQRMQYSTNETQLNQTNVAAAISRQGPDKESTKIWWAK